MKSHRLTQINTDKAAFARFKSVFICVHLWLFLCLLCASASASTVLFQFQYGNGSAIASAQVVLTPIGAPFPGSSNNAGTGSSPFSYTTDGTGSFTIANLQQGLYSVDLQTNIDTYYEILVPNDTNTYQWNQLWTSNTFSLPTNYIAIVQTVASGSSNYLTLATNGNYLTWTFYSSSIGGGGGGSDNYSANFVTNGANVIDLATTIAPTNVNSQNITNSAFAFFTGPSLVVTNPTDAQIYLMSPASAYDIIRFSYGNVNAWSLGGQSNLFQISDNIAAQGALTIASVSDNATFAGAVTVDGGQTNLAPIVSVSYSGAGGTTLSNAYLAAIAAGGVTASNVFATLVELALQGTTITNWANATFATSAGSSGFLGNPFQFSVSGGYTNIKSGATTTNLQISGGSSTNLQLKTPYFTNGTETANFTFLGQISVPNDFQINMQDELTIYGDEVGNFFFGQGAGQSGAEANGANDNVGIGANALASVGTGAGNTAVGHEALSIAYGEWNTAMGWLAGSYITTGTNNIDIGTRVYGVAAENNITRIGTNVTTAYISGAITGNGAGLTNLNSTALVFTLQTNAMTGAGLHGSPSTNLWLDFTTNFYAVVISNNICVTNPQNLGPGLNYIDLAVKWTNSSAVGYISFAYSPSAVASGPAAILNGGLTNGWPLTNAIGYYHFHGTIWGTNYETNAIWEASNPGQ
jgi:hypothetical protein